MINKLPIALLVLLGALLQPAQVIAQELAQPIVKTELLASETVPGQPIELVLTVLVPTWMPKPPVLPSFDVPGLMMRLPARSTGPVNERINSETWSGIRRSYYLIPLQQGKVSIPPETISITYANPEAGKNETAQLKTQSFTILARIPEPAASLAQFIAAKALSIKQSIDGETSNILPGDAVTRRIEVAIVGTSPIVIPDIIIRARENGTNGGLRAYPLEPALAETFEDDILGGSRTEQVTYVAQNGGRFLLPPIRLDWFNLETKKIETIRLEGAEVTVVGPPPTATEPTRTVRDRMSEVLPVIIGFAVFAWFSWQAWPHFIKWRTKRHQAYLASETYALHCATQSIEDRKLAVAIQMSQSWWQYFAFGTGRLPQELAHSFLALGHILFGAKPNQNSEQDRAWDKALGALKRSQETRARERRSSPEFVLPSLNPTSPNAEHMKRTASDE